MTGIPIIVRYALHESLRRRVFLVVLVLTAAFLGLYALGVSSIFATVESSFEVVEPGVLIDQEVLVSATLFGLSMFATLFLGTVLAIFFTLGVVRGDAERGLLQPLVVRPVGRSTLLVARFLAAAAVCTLYVFAVYAASLLITRAITGWWPDRIVTPALELAGAVTVVVGLSLLGSVFLSATANGIAVFMVFGAGLVAGLLGQIGEALQSDSLESVARTVSWALPFEALYQDGLNGITADTSGFTKIALSLGPFGGAQPAGALLAPWVALYLLAVGAVALAGFARRDL
jgi:ABC-type transport system involved in multi-copper enzyme maturation permease subunit